MNFADKFQKNKAAIISALMGLVENFRPAKYPDAKTPKGRYAPSTKKTNKGATHKVNPVFRSRVVNDVTPAEYRHLHMGRNRTTIPNYKKKHAAPKARNVVVFNGF